MGKQEQTDQPRWRVLRLRSEWTSRVICSCPLPLLSFCTQFPAQNLAKGYKVCPPTKPDSNVSGPWGPGFIVRAVPPTPSRQEKVTSPGTNSIAQNKEKKATEHRKPPPGVLSVLDPGGDSQCATSQSPLSTGSPIVSYSTPLKHFMDQRSPPLSS